MRDTALALQSLFSSFGIPAFVKGNVPEELYNPETGQSEPVEMPYITYELREPSPGENCSEAVMVWYRGTSYDPITRKVDEIREAIGRGVSIKVPGGAIHIWPEDDNYVQFVEQEDPSIKCAYLLFVMGGYKK